MFKYFCRENLYSLDSEIKRNMRDNCLSITEQLLKKLNVKYTKDFLKESILSHPDHPSLLSITDTLNKFNINNAATLLKRENINEIPLPAIVQLKETSESNFYLLVQVMNDKLTLLDDLKNKIELTLENFDKLWTGATLLFELTNDSQQPNINEVLINRRFLNLQLAIILSLLLSYFIIVLLNVDYQDLTLLIGLTAIKISGAIIGVFLLWYEIDKYNPTIQSFCGRKEIKTDCRAVLESKYANIWNGKITAGSLVFSYFTSSIILLIFSKFSESSLSISTVINYSAIPIILISAYIQKFIIRHWCRFCLLIQSFVIIETVLLNLNRPQLSLIKIEDVLILVNIFICIIVSWFFLKPIILKSKLLNTYIFRFEKIKSNFDIFNSLLKKSKKIQNSPQGLGIFLQNPNAKYDVLKVCNPYCRPCANAHLVLDKLYEKGIINLRIIFTARNDLSDAKMLPAAQLMSIESLKNPDLTKDALNFWYKSKVKNSDILKNEFPETADYINHRNKIEVMYDWCKKENINHTPTIFINGKEIPKEYSVKDLTAILL